MYYVQLQYSMLRFGVAKLQYDLLVSPAGFELSTLACEPRALPSELLGGVNWAAHASKPSVDKI